MPQNKFCKAIAIPKVVRSQPVSCKMGSWKKPIEERGPNASSAIIQAQEIAITGTFG
jgi:hypothetical protein